ncbi:MAG: hypothetical protein SW833_08825 [Cyanobacteriota bacterium]|nr:hypothetical protein [Cyanobacteriota bacterium]
MAKIIEKIGEWNPQFYREIKGKLTRNRVLLTIFISLCLQGLCVLPATSPKELSSGKVAWNFNWEFIFYSLNWVIPFALLLIGVYLIASDLSREQARGTLNFVRLSPQPSDRILLGKLLGVPILLYFGVALAIPLHLKAGISAAMPGLRIISAYPLWGGLCALFYGTTLLIALLPKKQGENGTQRSIVGVSSLLALMSAPTAISIVEYVFYTYTTEFQNPFSWHWFFVPLQETFLYFWTLGTLCVASHWIWQAANRRFRNPNRALISKLQSYGIVVGTQLWLLGFCMPTLESLDGAIFAGIGLFCLFFLMPIEILILASLLSPDRQTLFDWTRYRHQQNSRDRAFWKDLLLGEKSPAIAAIALNLALAALIWIPWLLFLRQSSAFLENQPSDVSVTLSRLLLSTWMTAAIVLIYSIINQIVRFYAKTSKQAIAIALPWGIVAFFPMVIAGIYALSPEQMPLLWLFSPVPALAIFYGSTTSLLLGFFGQLGILALLARHLQRTLKQAGISESKQLFERSQV